MDSGHMSYRRNGILETLEVDSFPWGDREIG
jgi:hypothetical protein